MDGAGVEKIVEIAQDAQDASNKYTNVDGRYYRLDRDGVLTLMGRPLADTLTVHTLGGLVAYLKAKDYPTEGRLVHVVDETTVKVVGPASGDLRQREVPCVGTFEPLIGKGSSSFAFGAYYGVEAFVIGLQTMFLPTDARAGVLRLVGNITDAAALKVEDDGVSQAVSTRRGVTLEDMSAVPNPVTLQPYRTFRELEQPESPFVLRVKSDPGKAPLVALFEADGGAWKLEAIERIAQFLGEKLDEAEVLIA